MMVAGFCGEARIACVTMEQFRVFGGYHATQPAIITVPNNVVAPYIAYITEVARKLNATFGAFIGWWLNVVT
jgi:hypothetical protein